MNVNEFMESPNCLLHYPHIKNAHDSFSVENQYYSHILTLIYQELPTFRTLSPFLLPFQPFSLCESLFKNLSCLSNSFLMFFPEPMALVCWLLHYPSISFLLGVSIFYQASVRIFTIFIATVCFYQLLLQTYALSNITFSY